MKKLKYFLLSICLMSTPIFAKAELPIVDKNTYEIYEKMDLFSEIQYWQTSLDNADEYYIWEISNYDRSYQSNTGTYSSTNCVPTTVNNIMNILGIEHEETVEQIKEIMKNTTSENSLKKGTTIEETIRFLEKKNISYSTRYIFDKEELKNLIKDNIIITNFAVQYVYDGMAEIARENNDFNSTNYNHCAAIVGYQEIDNNLQLLILETDTNQLIACDYDRWKMAFDKWTNKSYHNRLLLFEVDKMETEEIEEMVEETIIARQEEIRQAKEKEEEMKRLHPEDIIFWY